MDVGGMEARALQPVLVLRLLIGALPVREWMRIVPEEQRDASGLCGLNLLSFEICRQNAISRVGLKSGASRIIKMLASWM